MKATIRISILIIITGFLSFCTKTQDVSPSVLIDVTQKSVDMTAGSFDITVVSNTKWVASCDKSWITINPTSGSNDGKITATYTANADQSTRTAIITVKATGISDQVITVTQAVSNSIPVPTNGLMAYYPFNGNANDESGGNHNGTVNGAVLTSDRFNNSNKAYNFNGSTSFIQVPYSASLLPGSGSYSFSAWYKFATPSTNSEFWFFCIDDGDSDYSGIQIYCYNQNQFVFNYHYDDSWSHQTQLITSFTSNTWHHVAATFDRPNLSGKLYIDGALIQTKTLDNNNVTAYTDIFFGKRRYTSTAVPYKGDQDDIRIYNRSLSSTEIQALYHEGGW